MQQWEYMWIYVDEVKGEQVYVANGMRLQAQNVSGGFERGRQGRMGAGGHSAADQHSLAD